MKSSKSLSKLQPKQIKGFQSIKINAGECLSDRPSHTVQNSRSFKALSPLGSPTQSPITTPHRFTQSKISVDFGTPATNIKATKRILTEKTFEVRKLTKEKNEIAQKIQNMKTEIEKFKNVEKTLAKKEKLIEKL